MKAVVIEKPGTVRLARVEKPVPEPGWALVKVKASAVCATDLELIEGSMDGISYPLIPGHEWSGVVEEVGSPEDSCWIGKRVVASNDIVCLTCHECRSGRWRYCQSFREIGFKANGAYAEYLKVPVYCLCELPDTISFVQGALVEPLCVGLGAIDKAGLKLGETVTIIGAGSIGLNILAAARAAGARRVIVAASSEKRLGFARKMGAYATLATAKGDLPELVKESHEGLSDVVFEATGIEECIKASFRLARKGGRVVLAGYGRNRDMEIHIDDIHINNLRVIGAAHNWNYINTALNLIKDGMVNTELLATHFMPPEDFQRAIEMTRSRPEGFVKAMFTFED